MLLYTLLAGVAFALAFMRGNPDLYHHPSPIWTLPDWAALPAGALSGGAVGLVVVWVSQRAVSTWRWTPAVRLHVGMRQILGVGETPLARADIITLTCSSAIAEELFFRGWLAPFAGILLSSAIFGVLHYAPRTRGMWIWVPVAALMGLAFAGLYRLTGNLTAPVVAHGLINYLNLHFINEHDPGAPLAVEAHGPAENATSR